MKQTMQLQLQDMVKNNQQNFTWNFCQKNVSQVAKHSQTHQFTKMVKVVVNAKKTSDSNIAQLAVVMAGNDAF